MFELNKIYCMDCLDGMKEMEDKSVDLVLTDPPYGINVCGNGRSGWTGGFGKPIHDRKYEPPKWDERRVDKKYIDAIIRVSKNWIIFGGNYYTDMLPPASCVIVWDKKNGSNTFADCELAWTSFNTAVRKFEYKWHGCLQEDMKHKEERYHPTQKPLKLMEWIIQKYSKPNDLILDPFIGSGTTAVACAKHQRNFIGFELEQKYVDIANKRVKPWLQQARLEVL